MGSIPILQAGRGATVVASSVSFLRIGVRLWAFLTGGIGVDFETFTVPFVSLTHFAQYLLPLGALALDPRERDAGSAPARLVKPGLLFAVTILIGIGIFLVDTGAYLNDLALCWLRTFEESRQGGGRR
jgi:hypothetical protein